MKRIFVLLLCLPIYGIAQTSLTTIETKSKNWSVEGMFSTVSNSTSTTFGPSIFYSFSKQDFIGARVLAPVNYGNGTISFIGLYRHNFSPDKTSLLVEISLGENFYNQTDNSMASPSIGSNLGIIHRINDDISFGGIGGFEWTQTHLSNDYVYNKSDDILVYARLSIFGSLSF